MVRLHVLVSLLLVRVAQSLTGESEIDVTGDTISSVTIESPSSVIVSPTLSESSVPVLVHNLTWESLLYSQYSRVMLFQQMPYVYSIPVDASDNVECENYLTYVKWGGTNIPNKKSRRGSNKEFSHNQDHMIHNWIAKYYNRTVDEPAAASHFFLPFYTHDCYESQDIGKIPWNRVEGIITDFAQKTASFAADRTFMTATFPLDSPILLLQGYGTYRYTFDLRYLRSDNSFSCNGRDVYVPYYVNSSDHQVRSLRLPVRRDKFIFALCNHGYKLPGDQIRNWRGKAYNILKNLKNSIVEVNMKPAVFKKAMFRSNFCFILPGDTSSTSKVYKAIFSGCIPVIFLSFYGQLPFSRFIDWRRFSIIVEKEILNSEKKTLELVDFLSAIQRNDSLLRSYQSAVKAAAVFFDYDKVDWPSVYHLILLELQHSTEQLI